MDDDKDDKSLVEITVETVKSLANSVTEAISSATSSERVKTAVPLVEENFDAPPMTADEIARLAAAETQPVALAKRARRKELEAVRKAAPEGAADQIVKRKTIRRSKNTKNKSVKKTATKSKAKSPNTHEKNLVKKAKGKSKAKSKSAVKRGAGTAPRAKNPSKKKA